MLSYRRLSIPVGSGALTAPPPGDNAGAGELGAEDGAGGVALATADWAGGPPEGSIAGGAGSPVAGSEGALLFRGGDVGAEIEIVGEGEGEGRVTTRGGSVGATGAAWPGEMGRPCATSTSMKSMRAGGEGLGAGALTA